MKKLLISIVFSLVAVLGFAPSALAITAEAPSVSNRYWQVQLFTPALNDSNKTLNVEYTVLSTLSGDNSYTIKLYQNNVAVGSQNISHPNGDSGVFALSLPSTGSYTYKIDVTNNVAGETKTSDTRTIQIVDGPAPIVTTIQQAAATTNAGVGEATNFAAGAGGQTSSDKKDDAKDKSVGGQVTDKAATTADGKSLGAKTADKKSNSTKWALTGVAVLLIGGIAYYWLVLRNKLEE